MIKKFFRGLLLFFVAAVLSVGFASCKDDDETPSPGNPSGPGTSNTSSFSLVGTWKCEWEEDDEYGYDFATFNSDNTGTWGEYYYNGRNWVYDDVESFTYAIVRKETSETGYQLLTLRLYFGDEVETIEVEVLSSNKVVVDGDIYIRQ